MLDKEKADSEEKITRLNTEIGRVQAHLNRTLMDLQDERKRFSELEVLRAQEIDSIRQQYEAYERVTKFFCNEFSQNFNRKKQQQWEFLNN